MGGPDPTGVTDGHVWTADGADGADWEAAPGAGGGTTVVANPTGFSSLTVLHEMSIGGVTYSMNHRGEYSSSGIYLPGDTAWTGQGAALRFWIAREAISAGGTGPSILNPSGWGLIGEGQYKGLFVAVNSYVLKAGDSFRIGDNAYLVKVGGTYTGADLTDSANVIHLNAGGSGGGGSTTPVIYLARTTVDISSAFAEITLTTALTDGYMLAFDVDSGTGNTVGGRLLVPSALLRALPAFSAAPADSTDVEDAYIAPIVRVTLTSIITQGLEYLSIWYKDDTHLWIIDSRQEMTGVAITGYPMAGGAAAQSAGSGLLLAEQSLIANKVLLDEYDLDTEWSAVGANDTLYFAGIHMDSVDRVELGFNISSHYQHPVTITGRQLKEIGSHSFPALPVAATTVDAIYVSGRTVGSTDSREPMLINPKYGFLEERRAADRFGILMFFTLNTSGNWISLQIYVSSDEEIDLDYAYIIPRGAAA